MAATVTLVGRETSTPDKDRNQDRFLPSVLDRLQRMRHIDTSTFAQDLARDVMSISETLAQVVSALQAQGHAREAGALTGLGERIVDKKAFGGLGLSTSAAATTEEYAEVLFLVEAWLEALNSQDRSRNFQGRVLKHAAPETRPMTLAQKIFAQHVVGPMPVGGSKGKGLSAGDVVRVGVDWIIASELSWQAMAQAHEDMGSPGIWRNDRLWIAGDHVVHPAVMDKAPIRAMVEAAETAKRQFKMTEYQGMNYTIMHTEFVREKVEPGMLVIGSDSHTCSGGAVGSLSIGLGTADVMMTCSLGETWFKIPESIFIEFTGRPNVGISGKDTILHILKELKRNTVAAERIVEFGGEGAKYLSTDARFAICNMVTEFGGVSGLFIPDEITRHYISKRRRKVNKTNSTYFKPDQGAPYAGKYQIDLSTVEPSIAVYPNPDDVVPVSAKAGEKLDGVFIGACTTTEEELVLAALVLKVGLQKKLPIAKGKRHYVPGSLPVVEKLRDLGLLEVYEQAGFTRGPPGCSYCVGLSAEKASEGEIWLSSQNRNFQNRMGKGAIGSVTSAIVCAASSFDMSVTDPAAFLSDLDLDFWRSYRGEDDKNQVYDKVDYVEPDLEAAAKDIRPSEPQSSQKRSVGDAVVPELESVTSKVVTLGDFIDTDALSPGSTLVSCKTDAERGAHVLQHTHPEFRSQVRNGQQVVVAGNAFGVGSSRETAVSALKGAGVKAVIAKSFAFIYSRNQPSLGLLGFVVGDPHFYEVATDGQEITIDSVGRKVRVGGEEFGFALSEIEYALIRNRGITEAYNRYGVALWSQLASSANASGEKDGEVLVPVMKSPDQWLDW